MKLNKDEADALQIACTGFVPSKTTPFSYIMRIRLCLVFEADSNVES
jgi:hypothetical protein